MRYDQEKERLVPESKPARAIRRGSHALCNKGGIVSESIFNIAKKKRGKK